MIDTYSDFNNYTWSGATTNGLALTTDDTDTFTFFVNGTTETFYPSIIPDKNWMPYQYVEYEPKWHKKYARYKIQMENMWKNQRDYE